MGTASQAQKKKQVDVLCAVGELSAKEKHFVCSKPSEFSREAEGITGDQEGITGLRKAAGCCLSFAPGPIAHTGCGTVQML